MLPNANIDDYFLATIEATEESVVNALVAANTMTGKNGYTVHALPHLDLQRELAKHNRLV